jgi:FkbM family methyltransferase
MKILLKYINRAFRYRYIVDPNEIKYISKNLNEGSIAVDIGAHKGGYLYWMKKSVKENGKVYAFEPQVRLYDYLKNISAIVKYKNVTIENLGISSKEGEASIFIPVTKKGVSPGARIDHFNNGTKCVESKIQITTLDKYFFDRQIFPDLIKIDVEGHEKQVLSGGINLLKTCKPKIILECENRHLSGANIFDVFEILFELGYYGYFFEDQKLKPIEEFNVEINQDLAKVRRWGKRRYINNFIFEVP